MQLRWPQVVSGASAGWQHPRGRQDIAIAVRPAFESARCELILRRTRQSAPCRQQHNFASNERLNFEQLF
jgi:hypothetical protein